MKNVIFTLAATSTLFTACSKDESAVSDESTIAASSSSSAKVSEWQSVSSWQSTVDSEKNTTYSTTLSDNQITANGNVLVFTKGYTFGPGNTTDAPSVLPGAFYPPWEKPVHPYYWNADIKDGGATISVKMHPLLDAAFNEYKSNIRLRYFILPQPFLTQNNLTTASLKTLRYDQLVALTGVAP